MENVVVITLVAAAALWMGALGLSWWRKNFGERPPGPLQSTCNCSDCPAAQQQRCGQLAEHERTQLCHVEKSKP